ncbi:MAG: hypothetical protein M3Y45_06220 [Actinomycetota bacterium]|nr:hypothetical protein [Actinomycetota bacterium]
MSNLSPNIPRHTDMRPQGGYKPASELDALHETTDLDLKGVLGFTVVLILGVVVSCFAMKLLMDNFASQSARLHEKTARPPRFAADVPMIGYRLQADPSVATRSLEESTRSWLDSYGMLNPKEQTAHIPIDRAMAILAEKGLPKRGKVDQFHPRPGSSGTEKVGVPATEPPSEPETQP